MEFNIGSITVRTALRRGEFVVLGQSEVTGGGLDGPVFFIVHWPEKTSSARRRTTRHDERRQSAVDRRVPALEKPLYNVVYRVIWDSAESQDVVQETFLRCWRRKDDIRADGFKALLFRTALNLASNRRRSMRIWRMVGVAALDDVADESPSSDSFSKPVREALDKLPSDVARRAAADGARGHDVS